MNETIMQKMTVRWRRVKASRRRVRVFWRWMKAWGRGIWQRSDFAFLAMICAAVLVLFGVIFVPPFSGWVVGLLGDEKKQEVIKFIGWGIAGIVAIFGAVAVNRRATAQVKVADAQVKNNELVEKGHIQERFKSAVGHLGSDEVAARIASFYEFSYLARDNDDLRKNIFDILCAHLRQTTTDKKYKEEVGVTSQEENYRVKPTEEVQSLLDVLFRSIDDKKGLIFAELQPDLRGVFLMGADLQKVDLQGADLRGASLPYANLREVNLRRANLWGANLCSAFLQHADLQGAGLRGVLLVSAVLQDADLRFVNLESATLQHAILDKVNLQNANLHSANLRGAYLSGADLRDADLQGADLVGVDLRWVKNLDMANIIDVIIRDTKFPEGYKPRRAIVEKEEDPF